MGQRNVYLDDTYLLEADATVLECRDDGDSALLALDPNLFHPQGGGQPGDTGSVGDRAVTGTSLLDGLVFVRCPGPGGPRPGERLGTTVAASARRAHAAMHTAGHLVDAAVRALGYRHKTNNHFPGQARIEFHVDDDRPDVEKIRRHVEDFVADSIGRDLAVYAEETPAGRSVVIAGLHADPCGGTHVPSLGVLEDFSVRSVKVKSSVLKVGYDVRHAAS
jgi:Ser-tRNA(Ala) deacylase AlaX